jgi:hypothetical protein
VLPHYLKPWLNELLAASIIGLVVILFESWPTLPPSARDHALYLGIIFLILCMMASAFFRRHRRRNQIVIAQLSSTQIERDRVKAELNETAMHLDALRREQDSLANQLAQAQDELNRVNKQLEQACFAGTPCLIVRARRLLPVHTRIDAKDGKYSGLDGEIAYFFSRLEEKRVPPMTVQEYKIKATRLRDNAMWSKHVLYGTADAMSEYYTSLAKEWINAEDPATKLNRQRIIIIKSAAMESSEYQTSIAETFVKLSLSSECKIIKDAILVAKDFSFLLKDFGIYFDQDGNLHITASFGAYDYSSIFSHSPGGHVIWQDQSHGTRLKEQFERVWNAPDLVDDFADTQQLVRLWPQPTKPQGADSPSKV